jgi:hypothetical protein
MMNLPRVAIHNLELDSNCRLTSRDRPGSMRMLGVFGEHMSLMNSRVVCLIVSPVISHLSAICPDCKPLLLALDPQGLVRICQSNVCRMQHALTRM